MARNRKLVVTSNSVILSKDPDLQTPDLLNPNALEIYKDLTQKVRDMGLLMKVDCYMLSILANEIFDYGQIQKKLEDQDFLISDKDGVIRRNPLVMVRNKLFDNITTISKLYGFSPSGRGGLPVKLPPTPWEELSPWEQKYGEI